MFSLFLVKKNSKFCSVTVNVFYKNATILRLFFEGVLANHDGEPNKNVTKLTKKLTRFHGQNDGSPLAL